MMNFGIVGYISPLTVVVWLRWFYQVSPEVRKYFALALFFFFFFEPKAKCTNLITNFQPKFYNQQSVFRNDIDLLSICA